MRETLAKDFGFQNEKVVFRDSEKIVKICDIGKQKEKLLEKRNKKIRMIDDKFVSLDARSQGVILCHMMGYITALKDLISSGQLARANEISMLFEVMEDRINKEYGKM